jgi:hypothetical protein
VIPPWFVWHWKLLSRDLAAGHFDLFLLARWTAQCLGLALLIGLVDLLLGAAILKILGVRLPGRLRGGAALAAGAGASAMLMLALGLTHRISTPWVLGVTVLAALPGAWLLGSARGRWFVFGPFGALRSRWWLALAPLAVMHLWSLMMPVMEFDATMYHQAAARWYEEQGSLAYHAGIRFNAQPHLPILLFLRRRILFADDTTLKLVNLTFVLALYLALAHWARRLRVSSVWPAAFLALSPVFVWVASLDYADFAMTAWFAVAVVLLLERRPALGVAAFVLGCAAASKLQGTLMAGVLGLAYLVYRRDWRPVAMLAAGVAAVSAPWWIRSFVHTGSPVAPFFLIGNPEPGYLFELSRQYGDGRGLIALMKLPWNAMMRSPAIFADTFAMGPVLALALVAGMFSIRRKPASETLFLLALFGGYLLFWFWTGQVMRYLAAMLPVLAMLFAAGVAALRAPRWLALPFAILAAAASVLPSPLIRYRTLPPVRFEEKRILLAQWLPYYRAARYLESVAAPEERTYLWFTEESRYYIPTYSVGDWFGSLRYGEIGAYGERPQTMIDRLRRARFQYVLIDRFSAAKHGLYGEPWLSSGLIRRGAPLPYGLRQLYSDERYVLYRLQ